MIEENPAEARINDEANLVLAVKSTPSLNQAFNNRNATREKFMSTNTRPSEQIDPSALNLNVLSHEDLNSSMAAEIESKNKRPMTTKAFGNRRLTHQPVLNDQASQ